MQASQCLSYFCEHLGADVTGHFPRPVLGKAQTLCEVFDEFGRMGKTEKHQTGLACERGHLVDMQEILFGDILYGICGIYR